MEVEVKFNSFLQIIIDAKSVMVMEHRYMSNLVGGIMLIWENVIITLNPEYNHENMVKYL